MKGQLENILGKKKNSKQVLGLPSSSSQVVLVQNRNIDQLRQNRYIRNSPDY